MAVEFTDDIKNDLKNLKGFASQLLMAVSNLEKAAKGFELEDKKLSGKLKNFTQPITVTVQYLDRSERSLIDNMGEFVRKWGR